MKPLVQKELEMATAEPYAFEEHSGIVEVNLHNVILAEAVYQIRFKKYHLAVDFDEYTKLPDLEKAKWSAKNCFLAMRQEKFKSDFRELLYYACSAVNAENNTHLRKEEKDCIVNIIVEHCSRVESFKCALQDDSYPIIGWIRGLKKGQQDKKADNTSKAIRDNYSFATKLCHYASLYLFDDEKKDLYSIYDSVLRDVLINKMKLSIKCDDYSEYQNGIWNIIKDKGISRNGFDHLMWVYYS